MTTRGFKVLKFLLLIGIIIYIPSLVYSVKLSLLNNDKHLVDDVSRLNATRVIKVEKSRDVEGLIKALTEARENNLKVSIAGKRHSMGGHILYKDSVHLDMTSFNRIINIDKESKIITVQSGATWDSVIKAVDPYGLSVPVLQDYSVFTVGGSMSVNIHQSDPNYGPIIETIKSFRLLLWDGSIASVSREENPELFSLVIGGYGLFGVILDVDIELTENKIYEKKEEVISYMAYNNYFDSLIKEGNVENVFARLSIVNDDSLLNEMVVTTYRPSDRRDISLELIDNSNERLKKLIFGLSRKFEFGKKLRWFLQRNYSSVLEPELTTRNNLDLNHVGFLKYNSFSDTDILQEYFLPRKDYVNFVDYLRHIVKQNRINLLSATVRYVPENNESYLSYSSKGGDMYGIVLYFNVKTSDHEQAKIESWTRELIDKSLSLGGTYYLPYQLHASSDQIKRAYPKIDDFFELKRKYDPNEIFMNKFFAKYANNEED